MRAYRKIEVAVLSGVSPATITRTVLEKIIEDGDIDLGNARVYTEAAKDRVVNYFASRDRWERNKSNK